LSPRPGRPGGGLLSFRREKADLEKNLVRAKARVNRLTRREDELRALTRETLRAARKFQQTLHQTEKDVLQQELEEEQARRGQRAFRQVCSDCHYTSEFKGPVFTDVWARRTARDLYRELRRTMPDDNPGGLPRQTYVDVMAYILELNGYPAGSDELPPDDQVLGSFRLTPPEQDPGR